MSVPHRRFSDRTMQATYDRLRSEKMSIEQLAGLSMRSGIGSAFAAGRQYPDNKTRFAENSLAYAAWAAGVDQAREMDKPKQGTMKREQARATIIDALYGAPGERYCTDTGIKLIHELLCGMGLGALTDEAVSRLARMHQAHERRTTEGAARAAAADPTRLA